MRNVVIPFLALAVLAGVVTVARAVPDAENNLVVVGKPVPDSGVGGPVKTQEVVWGAEVWLASDCTNTNPDGGFPSIPSTLPAGCRFVFRSSGDLCIQPQTTSIRTWPAYCSLASPDSAINRKLREGARAFQPFAGTPSDAGEPGDATILGLRAAIGTPCLDVYYQCPIP